MDVANWALRTSPKFTTGVKINSIRVFDQIRGPKIPITLRPHIIHGDKLRVDVDKIKILFTIIIIIISVLPKGRSFTARTNAVLPPQSEEPRLQFYQGLNMCGSFPLLSAPHSLFST